MNSCNRCGYFSREAGSYCPSCGAQTALSTQAYGLPQNQSPPPLVTQSHHLIAAKGFGQIFGILPSVALLTLVVDVMLFGGEAATLGTSLPISIGAAIVLGVITYKAQIKWYGDDKESALIKGLILALLTAIPTALPAFLYVPSGIIGLIHNFRKK